MLAAVAALQSFAFHFFFAVNDGLQRWQLGRMRAANVVWLATAFAVLSLRLARRFGRLRAKGGKSGGDVDGNRGRHPPSPRPWVPAQQNFESATALHFAPGSRGRVGHGETASDIPVCRRKVLRDNIQGITKPTIHRLAGHGRAGRRLWPHLRRSDLRSANSVSGDRAHGYNLLQHMRRKAFR